HLLQQRERVFSLHAFSVRTITASGIIKIDYRDDPGDEGYLAVTQTFRIATSVPFFVVIADDVFDGIGKVNAFQNVPADSRVNFHFGKFRFRKLAWLVQNVFGYSQLSYIVKQRAGNERTQFGISHL